MLRLGYLALAFAFIRPGFASLETYPFEEVNLVAPDNSAKATFIRLGATVTNFWVKDKHGQFRDVVLGYDDRTLYLTDPGHPFFGPVVGRYANRIKNGTFSIPISNPTPPSGPNVFHVPTNEHNGTDSLHGGNVGWDRRTWEILSKSKSSVTFGYVDPHLTEGFPGTVSAKVTYTLLAGAKWHTLMTATADQKTPILLSSHAYWNLEAYKETPDILQHKMYIDSSRVIAGDAILVPTGKLINVTGTGFDFRTPATIGSKLNQTNGYCGPGCVGIDNAFIYDKVPTNKPGFSLWSPNSGIRLDVTTDQTALQIYTCNGQNGSIPRKKSQGGPKKAYTLHSCVVIEQESWIDAINNPDWHIDQIYGPGRDYKWDALYSFSIQK